MLNNRHLLSSQKFWVLLSLYMAQGLPTGIFTQGLPAILRSYDVPLKVIGLTGLLAIPWALKFLWAPFRCSRSVAIEPYS